MTIGIKVKLKKDFSIVRETLERIGIKNKKKMTFYPSCYCVESKDPDFFKIVHFKELFPLFGRETTFNDIDKLRRNTAVILLEGWGILEIVDRNEIDAMMIDKIPVLKHSEKQNFEIVHKFKFSTHIVVD
jgi:hypothetical protein